MNLPSDSATTRAVRIYVDLQKLKKFPAIDTWYTNSPEYNKATMKDPSRTRFSGQGGRSCHTNGSA